MNKRFLLIAVLAIATAFPITACSGENKYGCKKEGLSRHDGYNRRTSCRDDLTIYEYFCEYGGKSEKCKEVIDAHDLTKPQYGNPYGAFLKTVKKFGKTDSDKSLYDTDWMIEINYALSDTPDDAGYFNSKRDGVTRVWRDKGGKWDSKGSLYLEAVYTKKNDLPLSEKKFARDGKVILEAYREDNGNPTGEWFEYSESRGKLLKKGRWGKFTYRGVGVWTFWDGRSRCYKEVDCSKDKDKCDWGLWATYHQYDYSSLGRYKCKTEDDDIEQNEDSVDVEDSQEDEEIYHDNGAGEDESDELLSPQMLEKLSTVELSYEDLKSYSKDEKRILRNAIFAKHGYIFKSEDLKNYFGQFAWYAPKYSDINDQLNPIEKRNVGVLKILEE